MISAVLFDLDGTLSDSAPGIWRALRLTFDEYGIPWLSDDDARAILGPPFYQTLPPLVGDDLVMPVIHRYREHYVQGGTMFETECFPGMAKVVEELAGRGVRLGVATSKPEPHAATIVEHLDLHAHFEHITGDTLDGSRNTKALVIGEALRRLGDPDPSTVLMVGDRSHDVLGAAAHGVSCAGVLWGYGSEVELLTAGAAAVVADASSLLDLVR